MRRIKENLIVDLYEDITYIREFLESHTDSRNFYDHDLRNLVIGWLNCLLTNQSPRYLLPMNTDVQLPQSLLNDLYDHVNDRLLFILNQAGLFRESHVSIEPGIGNYMVFVKTHHDEPDLDELLALKLKQAQDNWDYIPEKLRSLL